MKKLLIVILALTYSSLSFATPGSFKRAVELYDTGSIPMLDNIDGVKLKGGCFTPFSNLEFVQNFEVSFKKVNDQKYDLEYYDPEVDQLTVYPDLVFKENNVETRPDYLSNEAHFQMLYRSNGKYLLEVLALHDVNANETMILNMCYYDL